MIQEAYVSYEVAKLLKEKRFNEKTEYIYSNNKELLKLSHLGIKDLTNTNCNDYYTWKFPIEGVASIISAPTQQMAMRWLREKYKIGVFPSTYCITVGDKVTHPYGTCIINLVTHEIMENDCMPRDTYEQACEAAIKYCLENLVK